MKKYIFFLILIITYSYSSDCSCSSGGWVLSYTETTSDSDGYLSLEDLYAYESMEDSYSCTDDDEYRTVTYSYKFVDEHYYAVFTIDQYSCESCPDGTEPNSETGICEAPPTVPDCPVNSSYSQDSESCECDTGYQSSYDISGEMSCVAVTCPSVYNSLSFFAIAPTINDCNFFELSDGAALSVSPNTVCCYGQEAIDDNQTCPPNNVEINGECYPIVDNPDDNSTDSHDCPTGEYWSFIENSCVPFFPDDNSSDSDPDPNDSTTDLDPNASVSSLTNDDLFGGEMSPDEYSSELNEYSRKAYDSVRELLDSYVLLELPVNVSGSCSDELVQTFTIFGFSYSINLTAWFSSINEYNSLIYSIVMFVFGLSGVVVVLSGRSE